VVSRGHPGADETELPVQPWEREGKKRPRDKVLDDPGPAAIDPNWQAACRRWRPPVERDVAWLVAHGNRRLRYHGTLENDTWLHTRAAALNLRRLTNL
jgi:hypothetical protein